MKRFPSSILAMLVLLQTAWAGATTPMQVFVSIPPQKWLSDQIGGKLVTTSVLVSKGQDPHTFEPSPKQIAGLSNSRIYFTIGMEFEQQIAGKLEKAVTTMTMVDAARTIDKIPATAHEDGEHHQEHGDAGHAEHAEHDGHADHDAESGHGHHHAGDDPHVWLSPANLIAMAQVMAEAMSEADPGNASIYRQNLEATRAMLTEIDREISTALAPYKGATFYVFHPSFGYFAKEYGLHQEAVEIEGKSPTPRQLTTLIARAKEDAVRIIFVQPQFDTKSASAVAAAIGGVVEPLDALAEDVPGNLRTMAMQISKALAQSTPAQP